MENSVKVLKLRKPPAAEIIQRQVVIEKFQQWTKENPPVHVVPLCSWVADFLLWFLREARNDEAFLSVTPSDLLSGPRP